MKAYLRRIYRSSETLVGAVIGAVMGVTAAVAGPSQQEPPHSSEAASPYGEIRPLDKGELQELRKVIGTRKLGMAYASIASVEELHLPEHAPQKVRYEADLSPGLIDPVLEEARRSQAFEDYKPLSDARRKPLTAAERAGLRKRALEAARRATSGGKDRKAARKLAHKIFLQTYIDGAYTQGSELEPVEDLVQPQWKLDSGDKRWAAAFDYTEKALSKLIRKTPEHSTGSLLPNPYPFTIPAGRFQEAYYWDTYFGMLGLLKTGRLELAQMQVENFLESVRKYGFIPNGMRDYYLSRSQPPFLSSMVRETYEATLAAHPEQAARLKDWLARRAYPLMRKDYEDFWMNPATHYDRGTGLNHHWDELNLPRPERHAFDDDSKLGRTFRDVRAAAESGLDFTEADEKQATRIAGPLLNGMLYKTETDLAWAAKAAGAPDSEAAAFDAAAARRKTAMDKYLWDPERKLYTSYHFGDQAHRVPILMADTAVPLFAGAASPEQAKGVREALLALERKGGIATSDRTKSTYQWDGDNGWAPLQVMAVAGLRHYGYKDDAERLARKWVGMIADSFAEHPVMYERMDVGTASRPVVDETKYPAQIGFLWTNSSVVWMMTDVLGQKLAKR